MNNNLVVKLTKSQYIYSLLKKYDFKNCLTYVS